MLKLIKKLSVFGTSKGVIIPREVLKIMGEPEYFSVEFDGKKLILIPIDLENKEVS